MGHTTMSLAASSTLRCTCHLRVNQWYIYKYDAAPETAFHCRTRTASRSLFQLRDLKLEMEGRIRKSELQGSSEEGESSKRRSEKKVTEESEKTKKGVEDINVSADAFIKNFRKQLLIQRLQSIENYEQMLKRGL
ncbi:uncharacterized protein HKW66_Vig0212100 [Vigna angularis]|uniref:DUF761 domain-containing protein n=1 Tax=Phaseolus angularis TaxID=3914 RepID=A0A8T0JCT7_PHAAN|nr:uncharacterized protein HKW66_Vig0212100 [Vigna angularis]